MLKTISRSEKCKADELAAYAKKTTEEGCLFCNMDRYNLKIRR